MYATSGETWVPHPPALHCKAPRSAGRPTTRPRGRVGWEAAFTVRSLGWTMIRIDRFGLLSRWMSGWDGMYRLVVQLVVAECAFPPLEHLPTLNLPTPWSTPEYPRVAQTKYPDPNDYCVSSGSRDVSRIPRYLLMGPGRSQRTLPSRKRSRNGWASALAMFCG